MSTLTSAPKINFIFLFIACLCILNGCAKSLVTKSGNNIVNQDYNDEIRKQGIIHYCSDSKCDEPPQLISAAAPTYPPQALAKGIKGEAKVAFYITSDGTTDRIEVVSATSPEFADAARLAVENWRFKPAMLNGKPVSLRALQTFPFTPR